MAKAAAQSSYNKPVVVAQRLSKTFRDFWLRSRVRAVDNLDLEVQRGEIFGLLGPNGSGKSTTIKLILGLLHKTSGRLAVFGRPPTDVQVKRRIGVLPEESYLYPFLNARETIDYYAKLFEIDYRTRKRRTEELLDMVGLAAVADRQVREYSKGMQRRIGLAQALINDPEFLILDEPTSGLDPLGSRQVKDLIIDLGRRGKTILLSSHQLSDVEDVVHRMAILYGGKKRSEGTCDELLTAATRTTLETESLDDDTIRQIDELVRRRTGGAILRVSKPRQKLEELFLDIVERARAERIDTAGASSGGGTAAFLLGQEEAQRAPLEGGDLITSLVTEPRDHAGRPTAAQQPPAHPGAQPDEEPDVIESLMGDEQGRQDDAQAPTPPRAPRRRAEAPLPQQDDDQADQTDMDVIGSLLDRSEDTGDDNGPERSP